MTRLEAVGALFAGKKVTNDEWTHFPTKYFSMGGAKGEQVMFCDSLSDLTGQAVALRLPDINWAEWIEQKTVAKDALGNAVTSVAQQVAPTLSPSQVQSLASGVASSLGFGQ